MKLYQMHTIQQLQRKASHAILLIVQKIRIAISQVYSTAPIHGHPQLSQPTLLLGKGRIECGEGVRVGYFPSPFFLSGSSHIEARSANAYIKIGDRTAINNNFVAIAESTAIEIGRRCLVGPQVTIFDSDFHALTPEERRSGNRGSSAPVRIGDDVFIGANVLILKGVNIGNGAVIAAGSVVVQNVAAGTLAAGNPARMIKKLLSQPPHPGT